MNTTAGARRCWRDQPGPRPSRPSCTLFAHKEALPSSPCNRLRPRPVRGHAQKPLGGVGFPSHARTPAWADEAGASARAHSRGWVIPGRGGAGRGGAGRGGGWRWFPSGSGSSAERGNRKWAAAAAVALAETAAGAASTGAGTSRGPPEPGERRSYSRGRDRCRAKSDKVWGRRGAPVSPAGRWPGRCSNGPLPGSRRGCRGPDPRKPGQAPGELEFQSVVF